MSRDDGQIFQVIANLRPVEADTEWESRLRTRCHKEIARHGLKQGRDARLGMTLFDAAAVAALCLYLSAVLHAAVRLSGML